MSKHSLAALLKEYDDYLSIGDELPPPHIFPTSLIQLHYMVSPNGGIPGGAIIQLLGENGHGKTSLAYDLLANAQKTNLHTVTIKGKQINAVILDFERSYDPTYARTFDIDIEKVLVVRTDYAETSFSIAEYLLLEGIQFVLVDSIGMLVAADEEDKDYTDSEKVAAEAKALGRFTKRANAFMSAQALVVVINQYRANLNKMGHASDKKAYGARVMQYANKLTLELRRIEQSGDRDTITVHIVKNKLGGKKGASMNFQIVSAEGIDHRQHTLQLAKEYGIVDVKGSWYTYNEYKIQGEIKAAKELPMDEIRKKVIEFITG